MSTWAADAWMGTAACTVPRKYDKTAEDREFRREQVESIGTGLNLADALIPQITKPGPHAAQAAKKPGTRKDPEAEIAVKRGLVRRKPVVSVPDVVELFTSPRY